MLSDSSAHGIALLIWRNVWSCMCYMNPRRLFITSSTRFLGWLQNGRGVAKAFWLIAAHAVYRICPLRPCHGTLHHEWCRDLEWFHLLEWYRHRPCLLLYVRRVQHHLAPTRCVEKLQCKSTDLHDHQITYQDIWREEGFVLRLHHDVCWVATTLVYPFIVVIVMRDKGTKCIRGSNRLLIKVNARLFVHFLWKSTWAMTLILPDSGSLRVAGPRFPLPLIWVVVSIENRMNFTLISCRFNDKPTAWFPPVSLLELASIMISPLSPS